MAIINYTDQLKYAGRGYLDAKLTPVATASDLNSIPITQRFEGLTVTVLNDGNPQDYWLVGGVTNSKWVAKTSYEMTGLKLALEEGFLKLTYNDEVLGDTVDLNSFFPSQDDLYIDTVDYVTTDDQGNTGVFMCFTYSDGTKKYLDMSQFLSATYEAGSGIVIDGNVISIDDAIEGRIVALEASIETLTEEVATNRTDINTLIERVNALSGGAEGATPDGKTIGITEDETKALYVKILDKEGNILVQDTNESGESGLYASIPVFYEDDELNEE